MKFTIQGGVLTAVEASPSETTLTIPEGVDIIERHAFRDVPHIRTLVLPDSLDTLHPQALRPLIMLSTCSVPAHIAGQLDSCTNQHLILRGEVEDYPEDCLPLSLVCPDMPIASLPRYAQRIALYSFAERYKEKQLWDSSVYEANHVYARQNQQRLYRMGHHSAAAWYYLMDMELLQEDKLEFAMTHASFTGDTALKAALMNYRTTHLSEPDNIFSSSSLMDAFDQEMEALLDPESDEQKELLWKFCEDKDPLPDSEGAPEMCVAAYKGGATSITYPRTYRGQPVTTIAGRLGHEAEDRNYRQLQEIVIPSGYRQIGENAFAGAVQLKRMSLPVTIASMMTNERRYPYVRADEAYITQEPGDEIGGGVLRMPVGVKAIIVQEGVTTLPAMTEGMSDTFGSLRKLVLPMSLEHIVKFPALTRHDLNLQVDRHHPHFRRTSAGCLLTRDGTTFLYAPETLYGRFELPDTVRVIAPYAFYGCHDLTAVVLPEGLERIGPFAFGDCRHLTRIVLPDSVTHIGESCFRNCMRLSQMIFGRSLGEVGAYAFHNSAIRSAHLPDMTVMHDGVFSCCSRLTDVHLPDSLTELPRATFDSCTMLREVKLPPNLSHIGGLAFRRCFQLTVDLPGGHVDIASTSFIDSHRCRLRSRKGSAMHALAHQFGLEYLEG